SGIPGLYHRYPSPSHAGPEKIFLNYLPFANRDNLTTTFHASQYEVVSVADALTDGVSSFYPDFEPPDRVAAA
ncbi:hypothetical protein, partial [Salmonella enterica]|uniref:hypothetical protein n=1 Tax=Salmonella enterica TaxID=28901 RepID=UPI00165741A6